MNVSPAGHAHNAPPKQPLDLQKAKQPLDLQKPPKKAAPAKAENADLALAPKKHAPSRGNSRKVDVFA